MRFVSVDVVRLDLSGDDWIEIKKQLSYGDMQGVASQTRGDFTLAELNFVAAYLLDWSLKGPDDKVVVIDTDDKKITALRNLTPADFKEIDAAIDRHVEGLDSAKKPKAPRGVTRSGRISVSAA